MTARRDAISVSQLNEYVRRTLAADVLLRDLCVTGEISNFKRHVSGHWYFTLKDEGAAVNCVMFRQAAQTVRFRPENGMNVRLTGGASLYVKTGSYQFYGERMEQEGLGDLYLRFERLKQKLAEEGLFDPSLKKPLPLLPRGVGIVTSATGAVVHDICTVAWRRNPGMPLYLCPVKVQGEGAAREIARAIRVLDERPETDVLIVGRGGGSMEDLQPFNEEIVARAVAACKTPVVSAVGHETDFTIADFVADVRAATPSAAAELCVQPREALLEAVAQQETRMLRRVENAWKEAAARLQQAETRLRLQAPRQLAQRYALRLEGARRRLQSAATLRLQAAGGRLCQAETRLRAAGPRETLRRGYAVALREGAPLRSASETRPGETIRILLADGALSARVETIERTEEP